jgi:hypothetical protein
LHLSADLTDNGAHLYHCPDPRLAAVHLKFGAAARYPLDPADMALILAGPERPLGELVALSEQPRSDTGCRVPDADFHAEMVGSFFAFFAGRSSAGGLAWARRTWIEFVTAGQVYSLAVARIPDRPAREAAWRAGLCRGARFLVEGTRPHLDMLPVELSLDRICRTVGQPPIIPW